jgi:hypothetical protein
VLSLRTEYSGTVRKAITPIGFTMPFDTGKGCAVTGTVLLSGITALTDMNLATTTGTQKETGTGWHRRKVPTSAVFEPDSRAILNRLCESTVVGAWYR